MWFVEKKYNNKLCAQTFQEVLLRVELIADEIEMAMKSAQLKQFREPARESECLVFYRPNSELPAHRFESINVGSISSSWKFKEVDYPVSLST